MKHQKYFKIIQTVLLANNFTHNEDTNTFSRGEVKQVIFNMTPNYFIVGFNNFNQKTSKEYEIKIDSHQSINKVLDRIELLTNKKLKTPVEVETKDSLAQYYSDSAEYQNDLKASLKVKDYQAFKLYDGSVFYIDIYKNLSIIPFNYFFQLHEEFLSEEKLQNVISLQNKGFNTIDELINTIDQLTSDQDSQDDE